VEFSMVGRVIRDQISGGGRSATGDREARKSLRRVHGGHRVRKEETTKSEERRN
jgi:hypothetical protein